MYSDDITRVRDYLIVVHWNDVSAICISVQCLIATFELQHAGSRVEASDRKTHHRCCFIRESDRKHTKAALMDSRLRAVPSYRYFVLASKTISFSHHKEDPHGFEAVCRWVAVFGD